MHFTVPDAPLGLNAIDTEFDSTMLSWSPPFQSYGIILHYVITYHLLDEEEDDIIVSKE